MGINVLTSECISAMERHFPVSCALTGCPCAKHIVLIYWCIAQNQRRNRENVV